MKFKLVKMPGGAVLLYNRNKTNNYSVVRAGFLVGHNCNTKNGIAHFCEHIIFKGSNNRTGEQIIEDEEKICRLNASTSSHYTLMKFVRTNRLIKQSFDLAGDVLLNPVANKRDIATERGVIENEFIRALDRDKFDPVAQFLYAFTNAKSLRGRLGNKTDLSKIKREDLLEFMNKYYKINNFLGIYVGNLGLGKVRSLFKTHFLYKLKFGDYAEEAKNAPFLQLTKKPALLFNPINSDMARILVVFPFNADFADLKNVIYNSIIQNYLCKNLNQFYNVLRKKGLAYEALADFSGEKTQKFFAYYVKTKNSQVYETLKVLGQSIWLLKNKHLLQDEFDIIKRNLIYSFEQKPAPTKSEIADEMLDKYISFNNLNMFLTKEYIKTIKKIKIDEIYNYIDSIFRDVLPYVVILGKDEAGKFSYKQVIDVVCPELNNLISKENIKKLNNGAMFCDHVD